jgi:hypothetical protein
MNQKGKATRHTSFTNKEPGEKSEEIQCVARHNLLNIDGPGPNIALHELLEGNQPKGKNIPSIFKIL